MQNCIILKLFYKLNKENVSRKQYYSKLFEFLLFTRHLAELVWKLNIRILKPIISPAEIKSSNTKNPQ